MVYLTRQSYTYEYERSYYDGVTSVKVGSKTRYYLTEDKPEIILAYSKDGRRWKIVADNQHLLPKRGEKIW